ncbi:MAG TPA: hypothetical protein PKE55_03365 [Kiritimatiellia bacterium]|mgnify:CR=1 FL=1|nr:hypothetical protein [Kiritimatiellia bacterium]
MNRALRSPSAQAIPASLTSLLGCALLLLITALPAPAYSPVDIIELRDHPQRFWARGVVFQDTLVSAPGTRTTRIGDQTVISFQTRILGECYVDPAAAEILRTMKPGADAVFSGTVMQVRRRFYYIVHAVEPVAASLDELPRTLEQIDTEDAGNFASETFRQLQAIIHQVQADLFAHAQANQRDMAFYFEPHGTNLSVVAQSIRTTLRDIENRTRVPAQEFLVSLIASIMADQYGSVPRLGETYQPGPLETWEDPAAFDDLTLFDDMPPAFGLDVETDLPDSEEVQTPPETESDAPASLDLFDDPPPVEDHVEERSPPPTPRARPLRIIDFDRPRPVP